MFHLHRFHWRRKRAALALLPATAMMFATGLAAAQTVPAPGTSPGAEPGAAASGARTPTKVKVKARRHVMAGNKVKIRGRVTPAGSRWVTVRVGGKKVKTVRSRKNGTFRVRWRAGGSGIYKVKATVRGNESAK